MAAETQYTANTGLAVINAANQGLTGAGFIIYPATNYNVWTVLTGATPGTLIKKVTIKAQGTPSQGMVRLFVYDGTNYRLLTEILVDPIQQSSTTLDVTFEKTVVLNFKLQSGYKLMATTYVADTFSVIAEAIDFAYYTTSVRPESTNYQANTGMNALSTANTSVNPTADTNCPLILTATAAFNGTAIESITIKATSAISADGLVRIFIYNSTIPAMYLLTEVVVVPHAQTATFESFEHKITFPEKLQLKTGLKIYATTTITQGFSVIAEALDWKYPA